MAGLEYTMLGNLQLSPDLVLSGLESGAVIDSSVRYTLGGRKIIQTRNKPGNARQPSLYGNNEFSLQDIADIRALGVLGQPVVLIHHRGTFSVLIISVDPEPSVDYVNPDPDDWYSATIYLEEV